MNAVAMLKTNLESLKILFLLAASERICNPFYEVLLNDKCQIREIIDSTAFNLKNRVEHHFYLFHSFQTFERMEEAIYAKNYVHSKNLMKQR